jgi:hypothetical protein
MDQKISRIIAGTIYGVRPSHKKKSGSASGGGQKFSLNLADENDLAAADTPIPPEHLPVSKPEEEEAGGQLDLTA